MSRWGGLLLVALSFLVATVPGWALDSFAYIPAGKVAADVADTSKGPAVKVYVKHDKFLELVAARDKTGQVEVHKYWTDYMTVLAGEAELTVGGRVAGLKETSPGEFLGDSISGGKTVSLHPGDIVTIPAGMPHWMHLAPGMRFRYLMFKTRD